MARSWKRHYGGDRDYGGDFAQGLGQVLDAAGVVAIEVLRFARPHSFLGREVSEQARTLARSSREEHRRRGYGFWEALLWSSAKAELSTRRGIMSYALAHGQPSRAREKLHVSEFLSRLDKGEYADLPKREVSALCSRVALCTGAENMHLPMIDFAIEAGTHNDDVVIGIVESLGPTGIIFNSGASYHFYGSRPLPAAELPRFLARAQLLAPLVDHRWISHQILDGECSLRISTDRERHKAPHRVVASCL